MHRGQDNECRPDARPATPSRFSLPFGRHTTMLDDTSNDSMGPDLWERRHGAMEKVHPESEERWP